MKKISMAEAMNVVGGHCGYDNCSVSYNLVSINGGTNVCMETFRCVDKYGRISRDTRQVNKSFCPTGQEA